MPDGRSSGLAEKAILWSCSLIGECWCLKVGSGMHSDGRGGWRRTSLATRIARRSIPASRTSGIAPTRKTPSR
jgi:hypothetical protein